MHKHFIITSPGRTASFWLANALDLHPDIKCSHGALNIPATEIYLNGSFGHKAMGDFWKDLKISKTLSHTLDMIYGNLIYEANNLPKNRRSLLEYFVFQEAMGKAKYYGNVHCFTFEGLLKLNNTNNGIPFACANMQRHPVTLIESGQARVDHTDTQRLLMIYHNQLSPYIEKFRIYETPSNITFLYNTVCRLLYYLLPLRNPVLLHIPMEKITQDKEYFYNIVKYLCPNLEITEEYLNKVFGIGRINLHGNIKNDPFTIFKKWPQWKQKVFQTVLRDIDDIIPKAKQIEYDLEPFLYF